MSSRQLAVIQPARKSKGTVQVINEFQSDTVELDTAPEPLMARFTLWALAALIIAAVTWGAIARIDRIVTARGKVISSAPNVVLQPLDSAIIRSINAKVGDVVKAGTVLATLDPTFTQADVDQIEARIANLNANVSRLEAEQNHRPYTHTAEDRFGYELLQQAIWQERKAQFEAQKRLFDERIARTRAGITARVQEREHLASRLKILREVESMRVELEQGKTGSRLNSLMARDSRIEIERNLANTDSILLQTQHELESINAERDVFDRQWDSKIIEEMVTKRNERDSLQEQLTKARRHQEMIRLETPVDAVVLEIAPRSVGSIIKDAEPFFKLVPLNAPLEIEAQIDAKELGYVGVGDPVQIKLDAYSYQEHGMLEGTVRVISGDAFTDPNNQMTQDSPKGAFYRTRIEIGKIDLRDVPDTFRLIPGMPLTSEIKVGTRSIMGYFLRPILRGFGESMREP